MAEQNPSTDESAREDVGVTMLDVLEQERELEEEYHAVLGASDEKCCTYARGAVKRQALYSCLTCCPESREQLDKCAGICLACSYRCHENHELVELYTKRNFRCDCPTTRFSNKVCVLNGDLSTPKFENVENKYDQNFQGQYCTCHRPYPDPERKTKEIMLQCNVCEDWFHLNHLSLNEEEAEKLSEKCGEMICAGCMQNHDFLNDYRGVALQVTAVEEKENAKNEEANVNVEECDAPASKKAKLDEESCRRPKRASDTLEKGATFWDLDWRGALCRCAQCLAVYKEQQVEFLLDVEDSAKSYEERGMRRALSESSSYEEGIRALASMGRVQQIDALTEYNLMRDKLKDYLQTFASSKQVVTAQDITNFFDQMRQEKRQATH